MKQFFQRTSALKLWLTSLAKSNPTLFFLLARETKGAKKRLVASDTDIVIEGFWRCANHHAVYAFMTSQEKSVKTANHFHAAAQIIRANKIGIPSVLLIREPRQAISSTSVYLNTDDVRNLLKYYVSFHEALLGIKSNIVISNFPTTTRHFDKVIAEVNRKFLTQFNVPTIDKAFEAKVRALVEDQHQRFVVRTGAKRSKRERERTDNFPNDQKEQLKQIVETKLSHARYSRNLSKAASLFQQFEELSV